MSTHRHIAKSAGVIGIAVFSSRVLGLIREIIIANFFGTGIFAQAFVVAFRIPNLLRDLIAEGAANAAFVPVFSEELQRKGKEDFWRLANVVLNLLLVALMALVILGIILSPLIVRLIAPGFSAEPEKLSATIKLTRIIFPYLLLIGLAAYTMAVLNTLKHFSVPAFAPCLLNISIIVCASIWSEGIFGLASGVLIGGVLQLLVQIPVLYKKGFRLKFFEFFHPQAKKIGLLLTPRVLSSAIYHLNVFIDTILGSLAFIVGAGAVAALNYAYRLILFPQGIIGVAIAQAALPTMSEQSLNSDLTDIKKTLSFSLRSVFFLMIPASVGFMVLSESIVQLLFERGKFDLYSTQITAQALLFYSLGLFAYGAVKQIQGCFFALKDTLTPLKVSIVALFVNLALNLILMFPLKLGGLALATSISGIVNFLMLFFILRKKIGALGGREILNSFIRISLASVLMGIACVFFLKLLHFTGYSLIFKLLNVGLPILLGVVVFVIGCFLFRVSELQQMLSWIRRRRG